MKEWRKNAGKNQGECAESIGVRQPTWSEYEIGRKTPRTTTALKIAELTDGAVPVSAWGQFEPEAVDAEPHGSTRPTGTA